MNRRYIIASGGTGGHFYPGFALGKALRKQGCPVLFIVRKNDPAIQVLKAKRLHYNEIDFTGLPRSINPLRHIAFVTKFFKSLSQTRRIVRRFRPDVAVGMGGYISFPLIVMAHFMGIKTAVHDSNARLGLANRCSGLFADLFMLGLPIPKKMKKAVLTSTPIRAEFVSRANRNGLLKELGLDPARKTALVVGGSQGAKNLNLAVVEAARHSKQWQFIHITGERWYSTVRGMHELNPRVAVLPYSHEIYALMQVVDLAICRSGASTLAELIYCRLPAVLVPFPHAAANHQYYNARILQEAGCALLLPDDKHLAEHLQQTMLLLDGAGAAAKLSAMSKAYRRLEVPNPLQAAQNIAKLLGQL